MKHARRLAVIVLTAGVVLVGCGVSARAWVDMSEGERYAVCESTTVAMAAIDWSVSRRGGDLRRVLQARLDRCAAGGYL